MLQVIDAGQAASRDSAHRLGALLAAGGPPPWAETAAPAIWTAETMHRSAALLRIYQHVALPAWTRDGAGRGSHWDWRWDWRMANRLGRALDALAPRDQLTPHCCDAALADICTALAGMLGPEDGRFAVTTDLAGVALPATRRRALVLSCACLVIAALARFVADPRPCRLHVAMTRAADGAVVVTLTDDGLPPRGFHAGDAHPIVVQLAAVLEAELACAQRPPHGHALTWRFDEQPQPAAAARGQVVAHSASIRRRPGRDLPGWPVSRAG